MNAQAAGVPSLEDAVGRDGLEIHHRAHVVPESALIGVGIATRIARDLAFAGTGRLENEEELGAPVEGVAGIAVDVEITCADIGAAGRATRSEVTNIALLLNAPVLVGSIDIEVVHHDINQGALRVGARTAANKRNGVDHGITHGNTKDIL